jgi:hypothetical protein
MRSAGKPPRFPVMSERNEKKKRDGSDQTVKSTVSALFEESGEVAPIDFGRFGKRVGEIIARTSTYPYAKPQ